MVRGHSAFRADAARPRKPASQQLRNTGPSAVRYSATAERSGGAAAPSEPVSADRRARSIAKIPSATAITAKPSAVQAITEVIALPPLEAASALAPTVTLGTGNSGSLPSALVSPSVGGAIGKGLQRWQSKSLDIGHRVRFEDKVIELAGHDSRTGRGHVTELTTSSTGVPSSL